MKVVLVAYASHPEHRGVAKLAASAERWGWPFLLYTGHWYGFHTKPMTVRDHLPALKRAGFTHVCHADSYDSLICGPVEEMTPFLTDGMMISCEKACWPDGDRAKDYPPNPKSDWCYINSGGYHGEIDFLGDVILPGCENEHDDQRFLTNHYLSGNPLVRRDDRCEVYQTFAHCWSFDWQKWSDNFALVDGRLVNKVTGTKPLVAHQNGGGSTTNYASWLFGE